MSNKSGKTKVALSFGILLLLAGIIVTGIFYPYKDGLLSAVREDRKMAIEFNESFDNHEINTVYINTSFDLNVIDSADGSFHVKCNGTYVKQGLFNKLIKEAEVSGTQLNIKFYSWSIISFFHFTDVTLEVSVPVDYTGTLRVHATSGDNNINLTSKLSCVDFTQTSGDNVSKFEADDVSMQLTSGKINLNGITAGKLNLRQTSGSIKGTVSGAGQVTLATTSGSMNLTLNDFDKITSTLTSGSMTLKVKDYPDVKAEVNLTSGVFNNRYFEGYGEKFTSDATLKKGGDTDVRNISIRLTSGSAALEKI